MTNNAKSTQQSTPNPTKFQKRDRSARKRQKKALKQVAANIAKPRSSGAPKFQYLCTVCSSPVFKRAVFTSGEKASEGTKKVLDTGLGKWRCKCGNKKVTRVKVKVEEVKVAA